jgi:hypothetical protein
MSCCRPSMDVSNRSIGPVGADSETTYSRHRGGDAPRAVPPSMPLASNLLTEALNLRDIGSNGSAMAVVSGGGPVAEIVAGWDILTGCDGVLPNEQPTRIAVRAIATGQHKRRFRMAAIVARGGLLPCAPRTCVLLARHRWTTAGRAVSAEETGYVVAVVERSGVVAARVAHTAAS